MATLVLSAAGTLLGGPVGGAIGALIGRQVDARIIGTGAREGPRLTELAVSTSSYGQSLPRVHGTMRLGGTIIWATDLVESRSTSGGKGQPKVTNFTYSTSFAVAISSRPIAGIGRIWADGNLLRGAAGDLKAGGQLRLHHGWGDQAVDPLIASAEGPRAPAFRGCAYAVFEDLDLTAFGNRIPALSFEIVGGDGAVTLHDLLEPSAHPVLSSPPLAGLSGFAIDGETLAQTLATIGTVYPLACNAGPGGLRFLDPDRPAAASTLPEAAGSPDEGDFGAQTGQSGLRREQAEPAARSPHALRHYDPARDYQPGIQRAVGQASFGGQHLIEFPGVLAAADARSLAEKSTQRARWNREQAAWRMAELDPAIAPGAVVRLPDRPGEWLVAGWEWRDRGVELELTRRLPTSTRSGAGDSGKTNPPLDEAAGQTLLDYFELPWDGTGNPAQRQVQAAVATTGARHAVALMAVEGTELVALAPVPRPESQLGKLTLPLAPSPAWRFERVALLELQFSAGDAGLRDASADALVGGGANRLLVGGEILQFAGAMPLGDRKWRLHGLLRGRAGTEPAALQGHPAGTPIVLLDDRLIPLAPTAGQIVPPPAIAAIGLGDAEPVIASLREPLASIRPMVPVHPSYRVTPDGTHRWCWIRRSRGSWSWPEGVEVPLVEQSEAWLVGAGPVENPLRQWHTDRPELVLADADYIALLGAAAGAALWVRQIGSAALSLPLLLGHLPAQP